MVSPDTCTIDTFKRRLQSVNAASTQPIHAHQSCHLATDDASDSGV